jgi:D-tyrosyl-tRNA(Tyr) deacylase
MISVIQRVSGASVEVDGRIAGQIGAGLLVLLGIENGDGETDADHLVRKITGLRIFPDAQGKMNLSVLQTGGAVLVISQFTLCGDCNKGMRPGFDAAARPEAAKLLYEYFVTKAKNTGITIETGVFGSSMRVMLINDGPVTLICRSKKL